MIEHQWRQTLSREILRSIRESNSVVYCASQRWNVFSSTPRSGELFFDFRSFSFFVRCFCSIFKFLNFFSRFFERITHFYYTFASAENRSFWRHNIFFFIWFRKTRFKQSFLFDSIILFVCLWFRNALRGIENFQRERNLFSSDFAFSFENILFEALWLAVDDIRLQCSELKVSLARNSSKRRKKRARKSINLKNVLISSISFHFHVKKKCRYTEGSVDLLNFFFIIREKKFKV